MSVSSINPKILIALILLCGIGAQQASAVDGSIRASQDILQLESTGLVGSAQRSALGSRLWDGQSREEITALIDRLPARHQSPTLQDLQKRLLLTRSNTGALIQDSEASPEHNILSVRMEKLLDMGRFDDALKLYEKAPKASMHESLAKLGISALALRGDFSTACLEEKVITQKIEVTEGFWQNLRNICSIVLEEDGHSTEFENSKLLTDIYSREEYPFLVKKAKAFKDFNTLELASLFYKGKIALSSKAKINEFPDPILALLLKQDTLPAKKRNRLHQEAYLRGLITAKALQKFYQDLELPEETPSWALHAATYQAVQETQNGQEKWDSLEKLLKNPGNTDLLPVFGRALSKSRPKEVDPKLALPAVNAMLLADITIPSAWMKHLKAHAEDSPKTQAYLHFLEIGGFSSNNSKTPVDNLRKSLESLAIKESEQVLILKRLLDNRAEISNNPLNVYEKHFSLTYDVNYVIPSYVLLDRMENAGQNDQTGLAVLIGLNIVTASPEAYYPAALMSVVQSLLNVGLKKEARNITKEILASFVKE